MLNGRDPDCNLQNTQLGQRGSRGPTVIYKNHETHPLKQLGLLLLKFLFFLSAV